MEEQKKPSLGSIPQTPAQAAAQQSVVQGMQGKSMQDMLAEMERAKAKLNAPPVAPAVAPPVAPVIAPPVAPAVAPPIAQTPVVPPNVAAQQSVLGGMQGKSMQEMLADMERAKASFNAPPVAPAVAPAVAPTLPQAALPQAELQPGLMQRAQNVASGYVDKAKAGLSGFGAPAAPAVPAAPAISNRPTGEVFRGAAAARQGATPIPPPTNAINVGTSGQFFKDAVKAGTPPLPPNPTLMGSAGKLAGYGAKLLTPLDVGYATVQDQQNPEFLANVGAATGVESPLGQRIMGGLATVGDKAWELGNMITAPIEGLHDLLGDTEHNKMPSGADSPIGKLRGAPVPNMFVDGFNAFANPAPEAVAAEQAAEAAQASSALAAQAEAAKQSLLNYSNIGSIPPEQIAQMQAQMAVDPNLENKGNNIFQERGTNNFMGVGNTAKPMTSEQARLAAASTPEAMAETLRANRIANRPDDWNSNGSAMANMAQRTNKVYDEMQKSLDDNAAKYKMGSGNYAKERREIEESRASALQGFATQQQNSEQFKSSEKLAYSEINKKDASKGALTAKDLLDLEEKQLARQEKQSERESKAADKVDAKQASGADRFDKALQAKFVDKPEQYNRIKKLTAQLEPALLEKVYEAGPPAVDLLVSDMDNIGKYTDARNDSASSFGGTVLSGGTGAALGGMFPMIGRGVGAVGDGLLSMFPATKGIGKAGVLKKALGTRLGGAVVGGTAGSTGVFGMMPDSIPNSLMLDLPKLNEAGTGLDMGNSALSLPKVMNDPIGSTQARLGMAGMATAPSGAITDLSNDPDILNSILRIQQMRANLGR